MASKNLHRTHRSRDLAKANARWRSKRNVSGATIHDVKQSKETKYTNQRLGQNVNLKNTVVASVSNTHWLPNRQLATIAAQTITWLQLQSNRLETTEQYDTQCNDVIIVNPLPAYTIHYMQDNENRYTWLNSNIWRTNRHRTINLISIDRELQCGGKCAAILSLFVLHQKLHIEELCYFELLTNHTFGLTHFQSWEVHRLTPNLHST